MTYRRTKDAGYIPRHTLVYTNAAAEALAADPDGLKTTIPTAVTEQTYTGGDINGVLNEATLKMRIPTVTTTPDVGSYNIKLPIQFVGTDLDGNVRIVKVWLTDVDGNETVSPLSPVGGEGERFKDDATKPWHIPSNNTKLNPDGVSLDTLTDIIVPPMVNTNGAFTFGVLADVHFDLGDVAIGLRAGAAGNTVIRGVGGSAAGVYLGRLTTMAMAVAELHDAKIRRIIATGTTAYPLTVRV